MPPQVDVWKAAVQQLAPPDQSEGDVVEIQRRLREAQKEDARDE
jgi:hypothetical protein